MANAGSLADVLLKNASPPGTATGKNKAVNGNEPPEDSAFSGLVLESENPSSESASSLPSPKARIASHPGTSPQTNEPAATTKTAEEIAKRLRLVSDRLADQNPSSETETSALDDLSALMKDLSKKLLHATTSSDEPSSIEEMAADEASERNDALTEILALLQTVVEALRPEELPQPTPGSFSVQSHPLATSQPDLLTKNAPTDLADLLAEIEKTTDARNEELEGISPPTDLPESVLKELTRLTESLAKKISAVQQAAKEQSSLSADKISNAAAEKPSSETPPIAPLLSEAPHATAQDQAASPAPLSFSHAPTKNADEGTSKITAERTENIAAETPIKSPPTSGQGNAFTESGSRENSSPLAAEPPQNPNLSAGVAQALDAPSFSTTLSSIRATYAATAGTPPAVDQVVLQINRAVKNGQNDITLQLKPGDLGTITIKLRVDKDDAVQGTVVADNTRTLEMLQKDSRSLERALQDAGLRAEPGSLQFSLGDQQGQKGMGQAFSDGAAADRDANGTISAQNAEEQGPNGTGLLSETYYISPSGVNIQV